MKESTKKIFKVHGIRIDRAIHNYIYFVYYKLYITYFLKAGRIVAEKLKSSRLIAGFFGVVFNRYHAKVLTYNDAKKILTLKQDIVLGPDRTKKVIPFQYANKIVLKEPEFIAVMDCPCRLSREKHCEPVNVCLAIGQPTAGFWLEHCEKYNVRKISQQEALNILDDAHKRGEITTAWFKVATGGRTGVICACCGCCCGGLEAMRLAKSMKYGKELNITISSGYTVKTDYDKCIGCGECVKVCKFNALRRVNNEKPILDIEACFGCGICAEKCKKGAKTMALNPAKGLPLDIDNLPQQL